jgi:lambda family phage minor tail protein L|tara:strand:+ start:502 stop:1074 length:573 start_codon:yes stop_codon:yes gene_type:complete
MSTAPIITDLQSINPSAVIELFELITDATLHGSTQTYRFHAGSNLNLNGQLVFGSNQYLRFPVSAEGFAYQRGQIPRPTISVSNALGTITAILLNVNAVTTGNDLTGATVKRIRTSARYIDAVNFSGGTNPLGTPDPTAKEEITYTIARKSAENRDIVTFELAAPFDLAGVRVGRQCTRDLFPSIGTFIA